MGIWSSLDLEAIESNASDSYDPDADDNHTVDIAIAPGWTRLRLSTSSDDAHVWDPQDAQVFLTPAQARVIAERLIRAADLTDRFSA